MPPRYGSGNTDPAPLGRRLKFENSGLTAKNKFLKGPMFEGLATWDKDNIYERGIPTEEVVELYRRWGEGKNSWGVIVTGNIDTQWDMTGYPKTLAIGPGAKIEGKRFEMFSRIAKGAKAYGSIMIGQLTHAGRQVPLQMNKEAVSASDLQLEPKMGMEFGKPHAATKEEIAKIIDGFAYAAWYLEKAGYDGVELHSGHGYLISQFLSRTTNKRTDEYGVQTTENRIRFLSEIIKAVRARVSPSFLIATKLNSVEFQDGGVTAEESREVVGILDGLGLDYIQLTGGTYENSGMTWGKETTLRREAFFMEWAQKVADALPATRRVKLYITGGLRSVDAMVDALNVMDGVTVSRPAAAEPHLPSEILEGRVSGAIRPVEAFQDFGMGMAAAGTQIDQIGRGKQPMLLSDEATTATFAQDVAAFFQAKAADGDKLGVVGPIKFSGTEMPFGEVAV